MRDATPTQTAAALLALGPMNLFRVGAYRIGLKSGRHPVQRLHAEAPVGPFFATAGAAPAGAVARTDWCHTQHGFGWMEAPLDGPPHWHRNPFRPNSGVRNDRPWWAIPDFDSEVGDIKTLWEASRFDWLIPMAQRAALGEPTELARINIWLDDWIASNPPFLGSNWKCGQEASIRVMNLAVAALVLGQIENPPTGLLKLIRMHLRRIFPTLAYAMGQQNNHGTSEAAALFIGGSWLEHAGDSDGRRWRRAGRKWLEDRARKLIAVDGTFSQYSVNYHRFMLSTYSLAEVWRRQLDLPGFSALLMSRLGAATAWLRQFTDPQAGDAPNIGANDGAHLMRLTDDSYRDHRPAVQLAAALFKNQAAYDADQDGTLVWLGVEHAARAMPLPVSVSLDDGGFHVLRRGPAVAYLRYPRFQFRPSQADALHLDLWVRGRNILRDAGTFSYNVSEQDTAYFNGVESHNTVQIDGRDQMPRISRFLFGGWLRARSVEMVRTESDSVQAAAAYVDHRGARHFRRVRLTSREMTCYDDIIGAGDKCVLRWRLAPGDWRREGDAITDGDTRIEVSSNRPIRRMDVVRGWESRFYLLKTELPVLEVEIAGSGNFVTRVSV